MKIILIIDRLMLYFGVKNSNDLAKKLNISPTTLSNWKARNSIDYNLIFSKCENINVNWLLYGKGNMLLDNDTKYEIQKLGSVAMDGAVKYETKPNIDEMRNTIKRQADEIKILNERLKDKDEIIAAKTALLKMYETLGHERKSVG